MTNHSAFRSILILFLLAAVSLAFVACKQKPSPAPSGGLEQIPANTLGEIENYKEILRKDPGNLQVLISLGNLYYDTNQGLLAIGAYTKALAIDPSNANVRTDMAICYRRTGNSDRAIDELKKAIAADPHHAQSRYNLGVILIHDKKDVEGGIQAWEGLLQNIPDYPYRDAVRAEIDRMRSPGKAKPKYK
jgi:cytochrome c-type biogenesis protein CcmH/NrfG